MISRPPIRSTLALACVLGLAACGSKSTGPSFSSTISGADAASAGTEAAGFAGQMAGVFDFGQQSIGIATDMPPSGVNLLNRAWQVTGARGIRFRSAGAGAGAPPVMPVAWSGCGAVTPGDTTDSDHDGIPNNSTVTISCDTTYASGVKQSIHGTIHINDITALYGFQFSVDLTEIASHGDTSTTLAENGFENATFSVGSASDNLSFTFSDVEKVGVNQTGVGFHQNWNAAYTPSGTLLALGTPIPDGNITFNGGFYLLDPAEPVKNFNFNILTTTPLHYVASCRAANDNPVFDAGVIQGRFNGSATVGFTATFTACGTDPGVIGTGNATS